MEEITKLIENNKFEEAKQKLEKLLEDEKNIEIQKLLGLCYLNLEEYDNGRQTFETVVKYNPEDATSWFYLGTCYDNLEDYLHAKTAYQEVIRLRNEYIEAYKNLCIVYIKNKEAEKAIETGKKALELVKNDYSIYYITGTAYMSIKKFKESVEYFEKAIELNPNHAQLYNNLGTSYVTIGDLDNAYKNYKKASEIEPNSSITYFNIASILQMQGKHEQACDFFEKAYGIEPVDSYIISLALSEVKCKRIESAIEHYKYLISQFPEKHNFKYNLACCYELIGEYENAVSILQHLVMLNPKSTSMARKLANLYIKTGQLVNAKVIFEKIILQGNVSFDLYYEFAHVCLKVGDTEKAEAILKKVIELNPEYALAHKDLGVLYLSKRLFDYAKDEFEKAYNLAPYDYNVIFEYANYLHATTNFKGADEMYAKALEIEPENAFALGFSALNKMHLNDLEKAQEQIDMALNKIHEEPFLMFIAGKIRFLQKDYDCAKPFLIKSFEADKNLDCENLLGLCYFELGDFAQANVIFKNILEKSPMNINIMLNCAKCYEKLNDNNSALEILDKIVNIMPDCEEAQEMIRKLS